MLHYTQNARCVTYLTLLQQKGSTHLLQKRSHRRWHSCHPRFLPMRDKSHWTNGHTRLGYVRLLSLRQMSKASLLDPSSWSPWHEPATKFTHLRSTSGLHALANRAAKFFSAFCWMFAVVGMGINISAKAVYPMTSLSGLRIGSIQEKAPTSAASYLLPPRLGTSNKAPHPSRYSSVDIRYSLDALLVQR